MADQKADQKAEPKAMPAQNRRRPSVFDRFADAVGAVTARAWFFAACVLLVVLWLPSVLLLQSIDTWQLIINTVTTIVTFLLVSLQANTSRRADDALQQKLNAVAAYLLTRNAATRDELRAAVGLEAHESTGK